MTHPAGGSSSGGTGSGTGPGRVALFFLIAFAELFKLIPRRAVR